MRPCPLSSSVEDIQTSKTKAINVSKSALSAGYWPLQFEKYVQQITMAACKYQALYFIIVPSWLVSGPVMFLCMETNLICGLGFANIYINDTRIPLRSLMRVQWLQYHRIQTNWVGKIRAETGEVNFAVTQVKVSVKLLFLEKQRRLQEDGLNCGYACSWVQEGNPRYPFVLDVFLILWLLRRCVCADCVCAARPNSWGSTMLLYWAAKWIYRKP